MIDNGAFQAWRQGKPWNETAFYDYLNKLNGLTPHAVVVPDRVAGGVESYNHSIKHIALLPVLSVLPVLASLNILA